jgi:NAD(P)H-flavin reductase
MNGTAWLDELVLLGGRRAARLSCGPTLVPSPGRYVMAHAPATGALLATALFMGASCPGGFIAGPPIPMDWRPGSELNLRGPLGHGFKLPAHSQRVALVAVADVDPSRLLPVAERALRQNAAVTLVCDDAADQLPLHVEVQPRSALLEVVSWCDYAAFDVTREALDELAGKLTQLKGSALPASLQVLIRAPMPCGGLADCGVCTARTARGQVLPCADGPVFDARLLLVGV